MSLLQKKWFFLLLILLDFYLLPCFMQDTGAAMLLLLLVMPLLCFFIALLYGSKCSCHWYDPFLVMILFLPSLPLYYNGTAWIYAVAYGGLAALGMLLGRFLLRPKASL